LSRLSDDVRVLTAVSWTYIVYAELINAHAGVGYLIYLSQRQSRVDKMFAILFTIIFIGFLQDQFFKFLDRKFFPYKYL
jgi:NitT/TauT family transport system permease protein